MRFFMKQEDKKQGSREEQDIRHNNRGVTLVELLIAMAIMAVVGVMMTSLFGSSTRFYRSTASYAQIQTESQTVSRRLANAVMSAKSIYLSERRDDIYLFTGETKREADSIQYDGEIFWFNHDTGCLYQNSSFTAVEDAGKELSAETVKDAIEGTGSEGREFRISDKVRSLSFTFSPELTKENKIDANFYKIDGPVTLQFDITFQTLDSKIYKVESGATSRNKVEAVWWNGGEEGSETENKAGTE